MGHSPSAILFYTKNPADVLSRSPISAQLPCKRNIVEEYINFITEKEVLKAGALEQISKTAQDDAIPQLVQQCLHHSHWSDHPDLQ